MTISTDSSEYNILTDAVKMVVNITGLSCEIGLRAGGGSSAIMQALADSLQFTKTHIAIDPYGNIEYETRENMKTRHDYTNQMRDQCIIDMYYFAMVIKINFLFFPLEDTEFCKSFVDGVPLYNETKAIVNQYAFVHFDGPHAYAPLVTEFRFFNDRAPIGAVFVFDDVGNYDHAKLETEVMFPAGWELIKRGAVKASYKKVKL